VKWLMIVSTAETAPRVDLGTLFSQNSAEISGKSERI